MRDDHDINVQRMSISQPSLFFRDKALYLDENKTNEMSTIVRDLFLLMGVDMETALRNARMVVQLEKRLVQKLFEPIELHQNREALYRRTNWNQVMNCSFDWTEYFSVCGRIPEDSFFIDLCPDYRKAVDEELHFQGLSTWYTVVSF